VPQPVLQLVVWLLQQDALVLSIMDHKVVHALLWELAAYSDHHQQFAQSADKDITYLLVLVPLALLHKLHAQALLLPHVLPQVFII